MNVVVAFEKDREDAAALRREAARLRQGLERDRSSMETRRRDMLNKAKEDAELILRQARREAEEVIGSLKKHFSESRETLPQEAIEDQQEFLHDCSFIMLWIIVHAMGKNTLAKMRVRIRVR